MKRARLRHRLQQLPPWLEKTLPAERNFYVLVAIAFGVVGYLAGVSLLGRFESPPISLDETPLPPVEGGVNPVLPGTAPAEPINDPAELTMPPVPAPEIKPAPVPDRSEFTEAENCRIWKRTFPEAAAKLKPGDSCF